PIAAVKIPNRVEVPLQSASAVAAMTIAEPGGRHDGHALAQSLHVEVVVASNFKLDDFVARPWVYDVVDELPAAGRGGRVVSHLGIEVALRLEVGSEIARAFLEQVLVNGSLFVDGQEAPQFSRRHFRAA